MGVRAYFSFHHLEILHQFPLLQLIQNLVGHGKEKLIFFPDMARVKLDETVQGFDQKLPLFPGSFLVRLDRGVQIDRQVSRCLVLVGQRSDRALRDRHSLPRKMRKEVIVFLFVMALFNEYPHEIRDIDERFRLRDLSLLISVRQHGHGTDHFLDQVMFFFKYSCCSFFHFFSFVT